MGGKLSELTQNDSDEVAQMIRSDFGLFLPYSGCYHSFKNGKKIFELIHIFLLISLNLFHLVELTVTAYLAKDNLPIAIQTIHLILLDIFCLLIFFTFITGRNNLNLYYNMLNEKFVYEDLGQLDTSFLEKETLKVRKALLFAIPTYMFIVAFLLVIITPLIEFTLSTSRPDNINGVNMRISIPMWTFYNSEETFGLYLSNGLLVLLASSDGIVFIMGIVGYVLQNQRILENFKLLLFSIENLEIRAINRYHSMWPESARSKNKSVYYSYPNFHESYFICLRKTVLHHLYTLRMLKLYQAITSNVAVFYVMLSSLVIAMAAYGILAVKDSPAFQFQSFMFCFMEMLTVGMMCYFGEETSTLSSSVGDYLFLTPWPDCNRKVKDVMKIIMSNSMKPLSPVDPVIEVKLNRETFSDVLNAAYTYVNLMYAVKHKD